MRNKEKKGKVYVVIPTYNRVELTLKCISLLLKQTYKNIFIIVTDGNSSDKTKELVAEKFPEVVILCSNKNLWWGNAMSKGIDYVLSHSKSHYDFILMMNNDTEFSTDYVTTIVNSSSKGNEVVGSLIYDIDSPDTILDAGVCIDWRNFTFNVKKSLFEGKNYLGDVDTLPGRGTLVPIGIVREVGNINYVKLPHYLADYEYFCRVKEYGHRLRVSYEAKIFVHYKKTGYVKNINNSVFQKIYSMFSRRSKSNIIDQYNFIDLAAPKECKEDLKSRLMPRSIRKIICLFDRRAFQ